MSYSFFLEKFAECKTFEELDEVAKRLRARLDDEFLDKNHPEYRENLAALQHSYEEACEMLPLWLEERRRAEEQEREERDRDD
jgi:hypothetical protein